MAKQTVEKEINPAPITGKDAVDYVNENSAERGAASKAAEDMALALAASFNGSDAMAMLKKVNDAKPEAFERKTSDFWKPAKAGDELRGIYLGTVDGPKYKVHCIGAMDTKSKEPMLVRVNGSTVLTKELLRGKPNTPVRILYTGQGKTDAGNKLQNFEVSWL